MAQAAPLLQIADMMTCKLTAYARAIVLCRREHFSTQVHVRVINSAAMVLCTQRVLGSLHRVSTTKDSHQLQLSYTSIEAHDGSF
jgi:hypothetical protein